MKKIKLFNIITLLKKKLKSNFFYATATAFLIWMLFFDSEDLISQYKLIRKYYTLKYQKQYYIENIKELEKYKKALANDKKTLEKFAREKYFMKKKNEDIYIVK